MEEFYVKYRNLYVWRRGALRRGKGPCACRSEGWALPLRPIPSCSPSIPVSLPLSSGASPGRGKQQSHRSRSAQSWRGPGPRLPPVWGFTWQGVGWVFWEIPAGLHGGWDWAQRPLWSCFVDYFFFFLCSSYLHCKWATLEELEKDPRISQKIKRFRNKQAQMKHIFTEVSAERSEQPCLTPAHRGPVRWTSSPRAGHCLRHLPAQTRPAPGPKLGAGSEQAALTV